MGGSSPTTGYKYFMDLHFIAGLARGGSKLTSAVRDCLMQIVAGDRIAWGGAQYGNGSIRISAPELFGGDQKEGGLDGELEIMFGGPDQAPNAYLGAAFSGTNPGYRNVFSAIYKQGQVACNNPYIKAWSFLRRRITGDWYGGDCWYEEKAAIPLADGVTTTHETLVSADVLLDSQESSLDGSDGGFDFIVPAGATIKVTLGPSSDGWSFTPSDDYQPYNYDYQTWWNQFALVNLDDPDLAVAVFWGNRYATAAEARTANASGEVLVPSTLGGRYRLFLFDAKTDDNRGLASYAVSYVTTSMTNARYCMNPAHVIYQVLTDPDVGMGYPSAVIDEDSFTATADALYAEGLGVNLRWTNPTTIEDFISIVLDHAGAVLVRDRRTGLFKLRLLRHDYNIDDLPVFDSSNCKITGSAQRPTPADSVNELQVTYTDYRDGKEKTVAVRNSAAIAAAGGVVTSKAHSLTGLPTAGLAMRRGMMDLDAMSLPLWRFADLTFLRDADTLEPGQPFVLNWPPLGIQIVMRVAGEIDYGNAANGEIRAPCVEDVFSLPDSVYTGTLPEPNTGNPGDPQAAAEMAMEVPYIELARALPPTDLAALPTDAGYVGVVVKRPPGGHLHYQLATRIDPIAFAEVKRGDFAPSATLSAGISPGQFDVALIGWTDLRGVTLGMVGFLVDPADESIHEMVRIDACAADGATATLGRGCGDTLPKAWPVGTRLFCHEGFAAADPTQYIAGEAVDLKVLPRTSMAQLALADAELHQVTLGQRPQRPYNNGRMEINGVSIFAVGTVTPGGGGGGGSVPTTPPAQSPGGGPASPVPGPNGGFPDDAPYPIPQPPTGGGEVVDDGGFDTPGYPTGWANKDGTPLDSRWFVGVDGKLHYEGLGPSSAYYFPARFSLPWQPVPRYTIPVAADVMTDIGTTAAIGCAWGVDTGLPFENVSAYAEYLVESPAAHSFIYVPPGLVSGFGYVDAIPIVNFVPVLSVQGAPGALLRATFDNVTVTPDVIPMPTTAEPLGNLDFSGGLTNWIKYPDLTGNPIEATITTSGGELSMTGVSPFHTTQYFINDTPLSLNDIGRYTLTDLEAWCDDTTTLRGFTQNGVVIGIATKYAGNFTGIAVSGAYRRGDWTTIEAALRHPADGTVTPGLTLHEVIGMRVNPGSTAKVRNINVVTTDDIIDAVVP